MSVLNTLLRLLLTFAAGLGATAVSGAPLDVYGKPGGRPATAASGAAESAADRAFRLGAQAQLRRDWAQATANFEQALKNAPNHVPALVGLASVALAQNKPAQAKIYLDRADKAAPGAWDVQLAWGRFHLISGDRDKAAQAFQAAHAAAPRALPPLIELGDMHLQAGRPAEALKFYRDAVAIDPENRFAVLGRGTAAAATGQRAEALESLQKAAALATIDPLPLRLIGRLHLEAGEVDRAIEAFDKGLQRQPKFVPIMLDRADALAAKQRWSDAESQVRAADRLAPNSPEIFNKLGDIQQSAGQTKEAEASYLKAIALAPNVPIAYNNLAWMTVAHGGDAKKAVAWAQRAVQLSPRSSPFLDTLGWAQRATGDLQGAAATLAKAIALESNVAAYHVHLGTVQAEMKSTAAARASFERALQLAPDGPDAAEARKHLAALS